MFKQQSGEFSPANGYTHTMGITNQLHIILLQYCGVSVLGVRSSQ